MSEMTTARIRRAVQENGHATSEWHSLFTEAEDETEGMTLVLCDYLDSGEDPVKAWSPEDFRRAFRDFKGAAYDSIFGACRDQLAEAIGRTHMEHVDPFMNWGAYYAEKFTGILILHEGRYYHFARVEEST